MNHNVSHLRAIGFALAGYTLWVFTDIGMKLAVGAGLSYYELMGLMGLSSGIAMLGWTAARRSTKKLRPHNIRHQLFCASCSLICTLLNAVALRHLPLALFYIVMFMAPMAIALLAALFLHEKLSAGKTVAIVAGFAGVLIAINPLSVISGGANAGDWIGYVVGTISVISGALWAIRMRRMTQSETLESIAFCTSIVLTVTGLVWALMDFHTTTQFGIVVGLASGILNMSGNLFSFKALKHTTAANFSQMHYSQIIVGAVMAYFIWQDIPTGHLVAGSVIIIASGIYIAAHAKRMKISEAVKPL